MINITKQIAIFLENKPGVLAKVCNDLSSNSVNILALTVSDTIDHTVLRMVVDKINEAIHLLETAGAIVIERDVIVIEAPHKPGTLAKIADYLSKKKQNIEYIYCSSLPSNKNGMIVIRTQNVKKTFEFLKNFKF